MFTPKLTKENEQLALLQDQWEKGGALIVAFEVAGTLHRVIRFGKTYSLHRYFTISGIWSMSVDWDGISADGMMEVIRVSLA